MRAVVILGALLAGACAATTPAPDSAPPGAAWRCDAEAAQSLVGSHVGAVTFPPDAQVRLVCSTCVMTNDYRSDRLTIVFDEPSGRIERVQCV